MGEPALFKTLPLKDLKKLLKGAGSTTRHIVLEDGAGTLGPCRPS